MTHCMLFRAARLKTAERGEKSALECCPFGFLFRFVWALLRILQLFFWVLLGLFWVCFGAPLCGSPRRMKGLTRRRPGQMRCGAGDLYEFALSARRLADIKSLKRVVGARGFEPPTSWSRTKRATKLRYAPVKQVSGARFRVSAGTYPLAPETWRLKPELWSGRPDLNWRPLAPQASALPGCATSRYYSDK